MEKGGPSARSGMRSRSPFLLIALLGLTAFLAFKYWRLSTTNGELASEFEALQIDLRAVADKQQTAENLVSQMTKETEEKKKKLAEMEAKVGEVNQKLTESQNEVTSLKDQLKKAQEAENGAKQEVEKIKGEKAAVTGELETVKKQVSDLQNAPKTCNKEACKEPLREVLKALTEIIGKSPINGALKQRNVDVMSVAGDLLEGNDAANAGGQGQSKDKQDPNKNAGAAETGEGKNVNVEKKDGRK